MDLAPPVDLNHRWATFAALCASRGWDDTRADGSVRRHHDGGGNWASMVLLPQGRALLFGHDHEYSDTYFREAAAFFEQDETDLLADTPAWWGEALAAHHTADVGDWVGFVYGWEDGRWQRTSYDADDGFAGLALPMRTHEGAVLDVQDWLAGEAHDHGRPSPDRAVAEALIMAGPGLTEEQLSGVAMPGWDLSKGVAAARSCAL